MQNLIETAAKNLKEEEIIAAQKQSAEINDQKCGVLWAQKC